MKERRRKKEVREGENDNTIYPEKVALFFLEVKRGVSGERYVALTPDRGDGKGKSVCVILQVL